MQAADGRDWWPAWGSAVARAVRDAESTATEVEVELRIRGLDTETHAAALAGLEAASERGEIGRCAREVDVVASWPVSVGDNTAAARARRGERVRTRTVADARGHRTDRCEKKSTLSVAFAGERPAAVLTRDLAERVSGARVSMAASTETPVDPDEVAAAADIKETTRPSTRQRDTRSFAAREFRVDVRRIVDARGAAGAAEHEIEVELAPGVTDAEFARAAFEAAQDLLARAVAEGGGAAQRE